jgi:hypothetical protein
MRIEPQLEKNVQLRIESNPTKELKHLCNNGKQVHACSKNAIREPHKYDQVFIDATAVKQIDMYDE